MSYGLFSNNESQLVGFFDRDLPKVSVRGAKTDCQIVIPRLYDISDSQLEELGSLARQLVAFNDYGVNRNESTEDQGTIILDYKKKNPIRPDRAFATVLSEIEERLEEDEPGSNDYVRVSGIKLSQDERRNFKITLEVSDTYWLYMKIRESIFPYKESLDSIPDEKTPNVARYVRENPCKVRDLLNHLASRFILNGLGVRMFVFNRNHEALFQQRTVNGNNTFPGCWEATASGYVDPKKATDHSTGKVNLVKAAHKELEEEIGLRIQDPIRARMQFPFEHTRFLGISRNSNYGHIDVFGYVYINDTRSNIIFKSAGRVANVEWLDWKHFLAKIRAQTEGHFPDWVTQAIPSAILAYAYVQYNYPQ